MCTYYMYIYKYRASADWIYIAKSIPGSGFPSDKSVHTVYFSLFNNIRWPLTILCVVHNVNHRVAANSSLLFACVSLLLYFTLNKNIDVNYKMKLNKYYLSPQMLVFASKLINIKLCEL